MLVSATPKCPSSGCVSTTATLNLCIDGLCYFVIDNTASLYSVSYCNV